MVLDLYLKPMLTQRCPYYRGSTVVFVPISLREFSVDKFYTVQYVVWVIGSQVLITMGQIAGW